MKQLYINGRKVIGEHFAYDGCHKIYVLANDDELKEAKEMEYDVHPIKELEDKYEDSCGLRFIAFWNLTDSYVSQWDNEEPVDFHMKEVY